AFARRADRPARVRPGDPGETDARGRAYTDGTRGRRVRLDRPKLGTAERARHPERSEGSRLVRRSDIVCLSLLIDFLSCGSSFSLPAPAATRVSSSRAGRECWWTPDSPRA